MPIPYPGERGWAGERRPSGRRAGRPGPWAAVRREIWLVFITGDNAMARVVVPGPPAGHARPDLGQFFAPVVAIPSTKCRWARKNSTIIGMVVMTLAVTTISQFQLPPKPNWSSRALSPRGTVNVLESRR